MLALDVPIVPRAHVARRQEHRPDTNLPTPGHPIVGSPGRSWSRTTAAGQYVKLAANKNYWRGAPKIDELDFVYFGDTTPRCRPW